MDSSEPVKVMVRLTTDDARMWAIGVAREYGLQRDGTDKLVQSLNLERLLAMLLDNPDDARRYVGVTCAMLRKDFAHEDEGTVLGSMVIAPHEIAPPHTPQPGGAGPGFHVQNYNPQGHDLTPRTTTSG